MQFLRLIITIFCLIGFPENITGTRILAIDPSNSKSHFNIFDVVMKTLADAGYKVDVVSYFPQTKPYPNYREIILVDPNGRQANDGVSYDFMHGFSQMSNAMIELAGNRLCQSLELPQFQKLIKNPPLDPPYDLFITEAFYGSCWYAFGRHLNVPVVALTSGTVLPHVNEPIGNPLNTAYVSEISDGSIIHMNFWQRFKNTLFTLKENILFNYYTEVQSSMVKKYFGPEMPGVRELERDVSLLLVNSHHTLSGIRPLTPAVVDIGGVHIYRDDNATIPSDLKKWLDDSKDGFLYLSFGTMIILESFPKAFLTQLYSGLERIAPLRVVIKVFEPKDLPPNLPKNVLAYKWIPQMKILQHKNIRGFVSHGGLLGVQEAVALAIPLIGVPIFADQPINIKNCVDRGIAVKLDYKIFKADDFVEAVNAIVYDPKYKRNTDKLSKQFLDRPLNARATALFWIEYILKHGSKALQSPAVELTWWQLRLLDVYGSILIVVLVMLYFAKLILSTLCRLILHANGAPAASKKRN